MDKIESLLKKANQLPVSPSLLPRLAQLLDNINYTDVHEMVDVIMFDSALTARLLQIANSAYFGNNVRVTNVGDAIGQLGYDIVFMLAAAISGEACLRAPPGTGLDSVLLWKHSVTAAFGSQYVARAIDLDGNLAFTAGLLHDLGKIVLAETYEKNYTRMFNPTTRGAVSLFDWEMEHYGCNHSEVGAALLQNWKLPEPIVAAVKYHHHPADAGPQTRLAASVCLGNALSHFLEQPVFGLDGTSAEVEPALKIANLTTGDLESQWDAIREKWQFVQSLCDLRK